MTEKAITATAYLRVSTDQQDAAAQKRIITDHANAHAIDVCRFVEDTASGATPWQKRSLLRVLEETNRGDVIIVSEISRIARSILGVLSFLEAAATKGVRVIAVKTGIDINESLQSRITVTILALVAEIERDLIRERTKAALAAKKAAGVKLGRPLESRSASKLEHVSEDIRRMLLAKVSKRAIARMLHCSPTTLYRFIDRDGNHDADTLTKDLFQE